MPDKGLGRAKSGAGIGAGASRSSAAAIRSIGSLMPCLRLVVILVLDPGAIGPHLAPRASFEPADQKIDSS
jgi:hypothetical protein